MAIWFKARLILSSTNSKAQVAARCGRAAHGMHNRADARRRVDLTQGMAFACLRSRRARALGFQREKSSRSKPALTPSSRRRLRGEPRKLYFAAHRQILAPFARRSHKSDLLTFFRARASICFIYAWLFSRLGGCAFFGLVSVDRRGARRSPGHFKRPILTIWPIDRRNPGEKAAA